MVRLSVIRLAACALALVAACRAAAPVMPSATAAARVEEGGRPAAGAGRAPAAAGSAHAASGTAPAAVVSAVSVRLRRLEAEVAALRELPFRGPVKFATQSRDEFRVFVREELKRELPPAKAEAEGRALAHMGFLPAAVDLAKLLEDAHVTQVAAYYDPREDIFRIIGEGDGAAKEDAETDGVIAHELTHALQHRHFDLIDYQGGEQNRRGLDEDTRAARQFVVEGEAMFLMMAAELGSGQGGRKRLGPLAVAGLRLSLAMMASLSLGEIVALVRQGQRGGDGDKKQREEIEALAQLPPLVTMGMVEPYTKGAHFISEVWARGGWAGVARLYREPPASTEQVLHPREKFLDARDPPVRLRLRENPPSPFAGARILLDEVAGELSWRAYFTTWRHDDPNAAASGWGGDRVWAWDVSGRTVALIATRWDDEAAATRFAHAYQDTLARRLPRQRQPRSSVHEPKSSRVRSLRSRPTDSPARLRRADGTWIVLSRTGRDVDIIDGARPAEIAPLLTAARAALRETTPTPAAARPPPSTAAAASTPAAPNEPLSTVGASAIRADRSAHASSTPPPPTTSLVDRRAGVSTASAPPPAP